MDQNPDTALRSGPVIDATGLFLLISTITVFLLPLFIYFPPIPPSQRDALLETHSPIGVKHNKSKKKTTTTTTSSSKTAINQLWIYPIKSCKGIQLTSSKVLPYGLEFDRLYTFAQLKSPFPLSTNPSEKNQQKESWEFITQRQFPLLATVTVELFSPDPVKARGKPLYSDANIKDSFLLISFPWQESGLGGVLSWVAAKLARGRKAVPEKQLVLPVNFPSQGEIEARGYEREEVRIWKDVVSALNMEKDLPRELALYLGVSNRLGLFRVDPGRLREVHRCAPGKEEAGYQPVTGFQDAYPLHLVNLASVRDFGAKITKDNKLEQELDARRFRANIIVDGPEESNSPYDEETWKRVAFETEETWKRVAFETEEGKKATASFHVSCRTVRCKMPNVNQDSGFRHPVEPDRSLRKLRDVDEGARLKGCLGMQLTPLFDGGKLESWVEVGMKVGVEERGEHRYINQ
ncbi:putative MOSC domain-containing protein [Triangularia verruculosa]|uniref:MOSC domain-containing protein n=1 Tax=Triangularia verruculosa TaxID=2587418 RepID=A0AAN7APP1_9PEZI|nr:putative MOSC domain-containing protein [Triangularia verruculosa]